MKNYSFFNNINNCDATHKNNAFINNNKNTDLNNRTKNVNNSNYVSNNSVKSICNLGIVTNDGGSMKDKVDDIKRIIKEGNLTAGGEASKGGSWRCNDNLSNK